ncbi:macro domain-containing protein [bacterium]|nr:macro domain-containing protein [bacterium]
MVLKLLFMITNLFAGTNKIDFNVNKSTISCKQGDILTYKADAIVNPANSSLKAGGGVCGIIFGAADSKMLQEECQNVLPEGGLNVGDVVVTESCGMVGFKNIFHVVCPNFNNKNRMQVSQDFDKKGKLQLERCYKNVLEKVVDIKAQSITFPFLSAGNFCRDISDRPELAKIALDSIVNFCKISNKPLTINIILYDAKDFNLFKKQVQILIKK